MPFTTLIAEDEPLARDLLRDAVLSRPELHLIGEAADGLAALEKINALQPDVAFLDIQMPEMSGMEVLKRLQHRPRIIFTTAYDQYAVQAFELHALDYLLKPFTRARFDAAVQRLIEQGAAGTDDALQALQGMGGAQPALLQRILVRDRGQIFPVQIQDIAYLQAEAKYTAINVQGKTYLVRLGIAELAERLDPQRFVRIHRSVLVNLDYVVSMRADEQSQLHLQMRDGAVLQANRESSKMLRDMAV